MKLEDIQDEWQKDGEISSPNIANESMKFAKLHSKYWRMLSHERLLLRKQESDLKTLRFDKYEFYTQGASKEHLEKGWTKVPKGAILKSEVGIYLESDQHIQEQILKIAYQNEKVDFLLSVVDTINKRSYLLKTMLDYQKFANGIG